MCRVSRDGAFGLPLAWHQCLNVEAGFGPRMRQELWRVRHLRHGARTDKRGRLHPADTRVIESVDQGNLAFGGDESVNRLKPIARSHLDDRDCGRHH